MNYKNKNEKLLYFISQHYCFDINKNPIKSISILNDVDLSKDISLLPLILALESSNDISININYFSRRQMGITTNLRYLIKAYPNVIFIDDYMIRNKMHYGDIEVETDYSKPNLNKLVKIYKTNTDIMKEYSDNRSINISNIFHIKTLISDKTLYKSININIDFDQITFIQGIIKYIEFYNCSYKDLQNEILGGI